MSGESILNPSSRVAGGPTVSQSVSSPSAGDGGTSERWTCYPVAGLRCFCACKWRFIDDPACTCVCHQWMPMASPDGRIKPLGTQVPPHGKIAAVGLIEGERYYWLVNAAGTVSMLPADCVENAPSYEQQVVSPESSLNPIGGQP